MAEALRKAIDTFSVAPQAPKEAAVGAAASREQMMRNVKRFENEVAQWRSDMLMARSAMTDMCKSTLELRAPQLEQVLFASLDEFVELVDNEIEMERMDLEGSRFSSKQAIATIAKKSSDNAHLVQKLLKRIYDAGVERHNARVDFYRFLLELRAQYNPDYRGGPTFESADELIDDLHKNAR